LIFHIGCDMGCVCFVVVGVHYFQPYAKQESFSTKLFYGRFSTTYIRVFKKLFGVEESESNIVCCHNRAISMNELHLEWRLKGESVPHLETE
jgi:hypothetical protein